VTDADPARRVKRYHAALNHFDAAVITPMFAKEATYTSPSVGVLRGRDAIIAAMHAYFSEFPDQVAEDETVELVAPNTVRCEWRLNATSSSTGRPSVRRGIETLVLSEDGLILSITVEDR
jgi:hypothetical protein